MFYYVLGIQLFMRVRPKRHKEVSATRRQGTAQESQDVALYKHKKMCEIISEMSEQIHCIGTAFNCLH